MTELETDNEDDVRHHIRKLMLDAIRFRRPEVFDMLEGYLKTAVSEKSATSEPQLPRILKL